MSLRFNDVHFVGELYTEDDFRQLVVTIEAAPQMPFLAAEDRAVKPSFRLAFGIALTALSLSAALDAAEAANPFDGSWWVTITTTRGNCSSGGTVRLRNGGVSGGAGGFAVGGRVAPNGAAQVSVSSGAAHASGGGRLAGNSGRGSWRGTGSEGTCSGVWTANRG